MLQAICSHTRQQQIRGLTRKGKEFFRCATPLAGPPRALAVADRALWAAGDFALAALRDGRAAGAAYVAPDRIAALEVCGGVCRVWTGCVQGVRRLCAGRAEVWRWMQQEQSAAAAAFQHTTVHALPCCANNSHAHTQTQIIPLGGPGCFAPVVACRDRAIRILPPVDTASSGGGWVGGGGSSSSSSASAAAAAPQPLFEVPTPAAPTALLHVADSHDPRRRFAPGAVELLYGRDDGAVTQLMVEAGAVREGFTLPAPPGAGAVRALHCGADFSRVSATRAGPGGRG